jgi:transcriptional regulator with XRE-family HTH domain
MYLYNESSQKSVSFREVRKKLKLTQDEVAVALGTKAPNISDLERGVEIPDWLVKAIALNRLLEKAGYTLNDLILSLPDPPENSLHTAETPSK